MTQSLEQQYVEAVERGNLGQRARLEAELDKATQDASDRLNAPDAILKGALFYARRGIAVFPTWGVTRQAEPPYACECPDGALTDDRRCGSPGKHPRTRNGFKDATTDAGMIGEWWARWPRSNVAAPTGIHFDVIDLDGRDAVGLMYGPDAPGLPPEIAHVVTERQAGHHYYIAPTRAGNKQNLYPAVDYRGAGGYVVLPPSVGASGRRWTWTRPLDVLK